LAIALRKREPTIIKTVALGEIVLKPWVMETIASVEKFKFINDGSSRDFMDEFVGQLGRVYQGEIEDKLSAIEKGELIEDCKVIPNDDMENIAELYLREQLLKKYITFSKQENHEPIDLNKICDDDESVAACLRRTIVEEIKEISKNNKEFVEKISKQYKNIFGSLSLPKHIKDDYFNAAKGLSDLNKEFAQIKDIQPHKMILPEIQRSPVYETNDILRAVEESVEKQSKLTEIGVEQVKFITQQTSALLEGSTIATRKATNSIRVGVIAIIVTVVLSMFSLWNDNKTTKKLDGNVVKFIKTLEENDSTTITQLNKLITLIENQNISNNKINQNILLSIKRQLSLSSETNRILLEKNKIKKQIKLKK